MVEIAALTISIGALLLGVLLLIGLLRRSQKSLAASQLEVKRCKAMMAQELAALEQSLTQQVAARTHELEQVQRELDDFAYSVSHDLAAPARKIHGFAGLLQDEASALSDEGREWLERIQHNSRQLGDMIGELLRISRLGRVVLDLRTVDLNPLVAETVRAAGTAYPNTRVQIAPLPAIRCDRGLMRQVFEILAMNAFKFSGKCATPRIDIGVQSREGELHFFVRDNGAGFDLNHAGKLFGVFQRMHKESDFPGIGAGLAIARIIIQRHGGRVWAASSPGEGATFFFTIGSASQPA